MGKSISKDKRLRVYNKYNGVCSYCGCKISVDSMHVDHIKPIYRGLNKDYLYGLGVEKGTNHIDNLNPSCSTCNISKSTLTLNEWRQDIVNKINKVSGSSSSIRILEKFGLIKYNEIDVIFYFEKQKKENYGTR